MTNWVDGIPYEIAFWEGVFSYKKRVKGLMGYSRYGKEIALEDFDVQSFLSDKENPIVVDAGCGMSFLNGDKLGNKQLNVVYLDPLAPIYNKIIKQKKLSLPEVTFGFIEYLSSFITQKVSLIIIKNALDHSKNPIKGVMEAIECLEIGGILYLRHFENEAETENYRGFHQFNISTKNEELIIWNNISTNNINELVKDFASVKVFSNENIVTAIIKKEEEVNNNYFDYKKDIVEISNFSLSVIEKLNSKKYVFKYHFNLMKYRIIQKIAQFISWNTRQKIKTFIVKFQSKHKNK